MFLIPCLHLRVWLPCFPFPPAYQVISACEAQPRPVLHGALSAHLPPSLQGRCCPQPSLARTPHHLLSSRHSAFHSSLVSTGRARAGGESYRSLHPRHIQWVLGAAREEGGREGGRERGREGGRREGEECSALKTLLSLDRPKCCPFPRKGNEWGIGRGGWGVGGSQEGRWP